MAGKKPAVLGIYATAGEAQCAVETLIDAGFEGREISMFANRGLGAALAEMGVPDYEARRYEDRVKAGEQLLAVQCETAEQAGLAKTILSASGAGDIGRRRPDIVIGALPLRRVRTTSLA
jgi:hypothetical protein